MNKIVTLIIMVLISLQLQAQDQQAVQGQELFQRNCSSCHKVDAPLIGPPLNEALENWGGDREKMYTWVKNWQQAVDAGYERALEVQDYDPSAMSLFTTLADEDIDAIFAYVENPAAAAGPGEAAPGGGEPEEPATGWASVNWLLVGLLILFVVIALILSQVSDNLERMVAEREGEEVGTQKPLFQRVFNKQVVAIIALISTGVIGFVAYNNAASLGRSQGYQPEQPIAFSHKLHAGTMEIDCQYCHTSAAVSKQATIPATNVCMNCHKGVSEGPTTGTKEIAKIYEAAGFNPENLQYDKEPGGPVEWVRIHQLPDHVFFSHAQHVTAGQIECQTCHGPVEEMEVVEQNADLSMGWCIDCHRNTEVQFTQNAYYEKLFEEYHDKIAAEDEDFMVTVEKIGGTECQKCHY